MALLLSPRAAATVASLPPQRRRRAASPLPPPARFGTFDHPQAGFVATPLLQKPHRCHLTLNRVRPVEYALISLDVGLSKCLCFFLAIVNFPEKLKRINFRHGFYAKKRCASTVKTKHPFQRMLPVLGVNLKRE